MTNHLKATLGVVAALAFTAQTHAATVWEPTDVAPGGTGDVNIIILPVLGISLNGGTLALFDDTASLDPANALPMGSAGGRFNFSSLGDDRYRVSSFVNNVPTGFIVTQGTQFKLAVNWGGGYNSDSSFDATGGDPFSFIVNFDDGGANEGNILAVDLTPVPLPAAAWLFGSALLGLVTVRRRNA